MDEIKNMCEKQKEKENQIRQLNSEVRLLKKSIRDTCIAHGCHKLERLPPSSTRDNGEIDYLCDVCGSGY